MADPPAPGEWLTYRQTGERLGLRPSAIAARARRGRWPKRVRNDTQEAEILVPAELLGEVHSGPLHRKADPPRPPDATPTLLEAVRAAVAPLENALEREVQDRRTLQGQADALREALHDARLEAAKAKGEAATERAKGEAAEARARARASELVHQIAALQRSRRWWWPS